MGADRVIFDLSPWLPRPEWDPVAREIDRVAPSLIRDRPERDRSYFSASDQTSSHQTIYLRQRHCKAGLLRRRKHLEQIHADTEALDHFPLVEAYIQQQLRGRIFAEIGRAFLIVDQPGQDGILHRDHDFDDLAGNFVWLRTSSAKQLIVHAPAAEAARVATHACWFDERRHHQALDSTAAHQRVSLRVDGVFVAPLLEATRPYLLRPLRPHTPKRPAGHGAR
ncbi:hypothetical protein [Enhygromyxa salina]|uniref:Aspartyl/asparaginy/proline hydroxylase domain-containing protein n=1 Tax=Enhygromyxa salina TaxID=215803 RepID=A0A2S9YJ78_9BACT|nr:hypothetical protein [Enhygromyxa salina]PRQ05154.1 hypothetical protein ENSA7_47830 [Enhygromyxa salina]